MEVTVHSYHNPTGRCGECQPGPEPGCCDETQVRPAGEACPSTSVCDTLIGYCTTPVGDVCEVFFFSKYYQPDGNELDFDSAGSLLGSNSTIIVQREEPWNVS